MDPRKRLAIIHTSFALVELLNDMAAERLDDVDVVNIVDDALLKDARREGIDRQFMTRMRHCYEAAQASGAAIALNACSSVSEPVDEIRKAVELPILKIDEPMAQEAARTGRRIAILATVESTLGPTRRLIESQALAQQRSIEASEWLCEGAFELLCSGKQEQHDRAVANQAMAAATRCDTIVFAQASMSRLADSLRPQLDCPILTSPSLAFDRLAAFFHSYHADTHASP